MRKDPKKGVLGASLSYTSPFKERTTGGRRLVGLEDRGSVAEVGLWFPSGLGDGIADPFDQVPEDTIDRLVCEQGFDLVFPIVYVIGDIVQGERVHLGRSRVWELLRVAGHHWLQERDMKHRVDSTVRVELQTVVQSTGRSRS